ncbi:hypothetical protein HF521_004930 [Silurus meridionalis]|uniref:Cadherin domain-containing protein n=1 Tax=Silurus meridionalis TaxID=175797 RepID=A0A8T0B0E0_SILME|nr:hypothetical protein HF521_004930 [Silurus meridionalis]
MSYVTLREDIPQGHFAFKILAYDLDNDPLTYAITEDNGHFNVSQHTGDVYIKTPLDQETNNFPVRVSVSDGIHDATEKTINIVVEDANDNKPRFENAPYDVKLPENTPVGTIVFKVIATDLDEGLAGRVSYKFDQAIPVEGLRMFSISNNGDVKLIEALNFTEKSTFYQLQINASDGGGPLHDDPHYVQWSTTPAFITIIDVPDLNPQFLNLPNTARVDEHSPVGTSVFKVVARDPDTGVNDVISYTIEDSSVSGLFQIHPESGVVSVMTDIDREALLEFNANVKLTVKATEANLDVNGVHASTTSELDVLIDDVNDQWPLFYKCEGDVCTETNDFSGEVDEHASVGLSVNGLNMRVKDIDAVKNSRFLLHLEGPDKEVFSVSPKEDMSDQAVQILIKDSAAVDYEKNKTMIVQVVATDKGNSSFVSSATVTIKVNDMNDNFPTFEKNVYDLFVPEHCENGFILGTIMARDDDEPGSNNSAIKYGIEPGEYSTNFTIDEKTGQLRSKGTLDREDINITLNGVITLNVTATDMGTPPHSSWVKFIINVDDENDNSPVFLQSEYTFSVNESERGATVGYVYATDADQTDYNNRISFSIKSGAGGTFLCVSEPDGADYRGKIRVDPDVSLDYESNNKRYTLIIEATDQGGNAATCTVHIVVLDVNDTPPIFPSGITMEVEENAPAGTELGTIVGRDLDTKHLLVYELVSTSCHCNLTWAPCKEQWFTLELNGTIMTAEGITIDYEECTRVNMTARVVDLYTEKGRNSTEGAVMINIIDVNDNAPEFIPVQEFFVLISENIEQDKSVARVYAKDRDSGANKKIEFQVTLVEFASTNPDDKPQPTDLIFYADTEQPDAEGNYRGVIKSRNSLEADKQGKYLVTVAAINGNFSTNEILELITVDKSYKVSLRFDSSIGQVNENLPYIRSALVGATHAMVHIVKVTPDTSEAAQRKVTTLVEAYFVFVNGTALTSDNVGKILNSQQVYEEYGVLLQQYGLTSILAGGETEKENNPVLFVMLGLVAGLVIVLIVTMTSLVCIRRKYKTKLKAAKAMNTAAMVADEFQKEGPVVPGTNKYTREGANPILNLNIDASTDLGFDEEASSADRESLNSLDFINVDMNMGDKDTMPMMAIEEEKENGGDSSYIEPLGAALAHRGNKKSSKGPALTFDNPSLNTTDL